MICFSLSQAAHGAAPPDQGRDERREVWQTVLRELRNPALDSEGRAACAALLEHLTDTVPAAERSRLFTALQALQ